MLESFLAMVFVFCVVANFIINEKETGYEDENYL
jgi:hypothetical protein